MIHDYYLVVDDLVAEKTARLSGASYEYVKNLDYYAFFDFLHGSLGIETNPDTHVTERIVEALNKLSDQDS
jgi:hypothetical protein